MHFGIDYGSKLAGTTVITYDVGNTLFQICSEKRQDADMLIVDSAKKWKPDHIYIDAPLSIPKAYFGDGEDFFYRQGDKELGAMSPMFLGGLTARAMKLNNQLTNDIEVVFYETYPGAFVRADENLCQYYSKKNIEQLAPCLEIIASYIPDFVLPKIHSTHSLDSILAWISGYLHQLGKARIVGDEIEGTIIY